MFKEKGAAAPAGMFTWSHLGLVLFFGGLAVLFFLVSRKWDKARISVFFKVYSLILFALELFKVVWNLAVYGNTLENLNNYLPLYYCSIFLYTFVLIAWTNGKLAHASYVWFTYGGLIAGGAFLSYPSSSLLLYPFYHFLSLHSILFHVSLVLVSIMILYHRFYVPSQKDFLPFIYLSLIFMGAAFIINKAVGTNLMFLEEPLSLAPFAWLAAQSQIGFEIVMFLAQLVLPFVFSHWIFLALTKFTKLKVYPPDLNP